VTGMFAMSGIVLFMVGCVCWSRRGWHRACGWFASSNFCYVVEDIMAHERGWAIWNTLWGAWYLYIWWNGGGGDKTKKRLKKLARKFTPVRRTAPSYGMEATHGDQDAALEA
jgi:hypothetical protein